MRFLFLVTWLVVTGCSKSDPIEACVEAKKRYQFLQDCKDLDGSGCDKETRGILVAAFEPIWQESCMRAAAGKD